MNQDANETQFLIQRIYVKNLSYETTNTPQVFQQKWEPNMQLDVNTSYNTLDNEVFEVVVSVTVTVKNQQTTAFLVEVHQAGIFTIQGAPKEHLEYLLKSFCPSILFPYAREAVTTEVNRGSFPQLVLAPIHFDAMFAQEEQKNQSAANNIIIDEN